MPTGTVSWYDARRGEGGIVARSREYQVRGADMSARARVSGARVRFDVRRAGGIRQAIRVRELSGTRTVARQRRFGDLTGAARPADKGRLASTHRHPDTTPRTRSPSALVQRWVAAANRNRLDRVLPLYAQHAVLHLGGRTWRGRGKLCGFLCDSRLLTTGWQTSAAADGDNALATRCEHVEHPGLGSRFRVMNGRIVEQWIEPPGTGVER